MRTGGGGTGGTCPSPLLEPKILKSALFYPEFPVDKVPQALVPPPHFSTRSSASGSMKGELVLGELHNVA